VGTIGEFIRWIGIVLAAIRDAVAKRYRIGRAQLLKRDVVVAGSERRFRALLESAPDSIVLVDWHGHIQLINAQTERAFGYSRGELVGQSVSRLVPERMRPEGRVQFRDYVQDPRPWGIGGDVELAGLRRDGSEFPVEISLGPLETDRGLLISAMIRDVTDRKNAEAALREAEAEERFRIAFQEAPVGIAVADLDGGLVRVNRALCEITGHPREHLETLTLSDLLHPEDRAEDAAAVARLLAGDARRHRAERRVVDAAGDTVPVDMGVALVLDHDVPHHLLVQVNDITERKHVERQLRHLAEHDPLTGLFNRRRFEQALDRLLGHGVGGAVLAIDLDHFKLVNDTLGHSVGDELIVHVAKLFRQRLRSGDTLARLGGDEFAVILPGADTREATHVASDLLDALNDSSRDADPSSAMRWVTASVGIASLGDGSGSAEQTLIEADIAMYDAKEAGRNRVALFDATSNRQGRMQERLTWADRIRSALDEDRFVLHAQPIVSLSDDPTPRYELLIRMLGDDGELIAPGTFLELAERMELVQSIDRWVISRAVATLAREKRAGRPIMLAINLSAKSVIDPGMPSFIAGELSAAGIDGSGLCLEMTETATVEHVDRAQRFAHEMSELGCEFALDDFGAGFASFYHLKHLVFDHLKIDGEFIRDLPNSKVNQLVVQSVVTIARGLGKRTIAEFVGDAETVALLREYGVDFGQGFYLARPAPLDELDLDAFPSVPGIDSASCPR
jgi:diguanylate cyclase (GGDEF)-like protein/PAS domain S-box-containing protein